MLIEDLRISFSGVGWIWWQRCWSGGGLASWVINTCSSRLGSVVAWILLKGLKPASSPQLGVGDIFGWSLLVWVKYEMCDMRCRYRTCWIISSCHEIQLAIGEYRGMLGSVDAAALYVFKCLYFCSYHIIQVRVIPHVFDRKRIFLPSLPGS